MESFWLILLFLVFPIFGVVLTVIGIFKFRNYSSKGTLYVGISIVAVPFLYLLLLGFFQFGLEGDLIGSYSIGNDEKMLTIHDNGTFSLKNSDNYSMFEDGKWTIQEIDVPILILDFSTPRKADLWLEVSISEKDITLTSRSFLNDVAMQFTKEKSIR